MIKKTKQEKYGFPPEGTEYISPAGDHMTVPKVDIIHPTIPKKSYAELEGEIRRLWKRYTALANEHLRFREMVVNDCGNLLKKMDEIK